MRTAVIGLAILVALAPVAGAQHWTRTFDTPSVETVRATADGGFVAGGNLGGAWLLRGDADGMPVWQRSFTATDAWSFSHADPSPDGGCLLAAASASGALCVAKVDADGDVVWARALRNPRGLVDLAALADGGALVLGQSSFWKLDASGATLRYEELELYAQTDFESVAPTPDGGAILAGHSRNAGDAPWLVRLDAAGAVAAQATIELDDQEEILLLSVAATTDGGGVLALWTQGYDVMFLRAVRVDASLAVEWGTELDQMGWSETYDACQLADGAIALGAILESGSVRDQQMPWMNATTLIVVEPTGTLRWMRGYAPFAVPELSSLPDGGILVWSEPILAGSEPILRRLDASGVAGDTCHGESADLPFRLLGWSTTSQPTAIVAQPLVADVVPVTLVATDTSVTLSHLGDAHEPDDSCSLSAPFPDGTEARDFCDDAEDWQDLIACEGSTCEIATSSLGALTDTVVEIFSPDCATILASDDDGGGGLASRLAWVAPADGTYHVRVRQRDATSGFDRGYELTLARAGPGCETWRRDLRAAGDHRRTEAGALTFLEDGRLAMAGCWPLATTSTLGALVATFGSWGEPLWHDGYSSPGTGWNADYLTTILALPGGGALVAGYVGLTGRGIVRALDPSGALLWEKTYTSSLSSGRSLHIRRVLAMSGGGFALVGGTADFRPTTPAILRIDESGTIVWDRELLAPNLTTASDGVATSDGGLLIASPTSDGGLLISKLDRDGAISWQRLHVFPVDSWLAACTRTADGGIVATAGDTVLRFDGAGALTWSRLVGDGLAWMRAEAVAPMADGGVVVAGSRFVGAANETPFLVRLDASGDVLWQRVAPGADLAGEAFTTIAPTPEGGFVAATNPWAGASIFKVDGAGSMRGACQLEPADLPVGPGRTDTMDVALANPSLRSSIGGLSEVAVDRGLVASLACAGGLRPPPVELCFNGIDDDGDGLVDCLDGSCAASDVDDDGAFDCVDCAPFDDGAREAPGEVEDLRVVKVVPDGFMVHLTWSDSALVAAGDGTVHDLTSGSIAALHASGWSSPATCVGNDVAQLDRHDMRPFVTECWWLVRAENACGTGSWGGSAVPLPDCP